MKVNYQINYNLIEDQQNISKNKKNLGLLYKEAQTCTEGCKGVKKLTYYANIYFGHISEKV